MERYVEIENPGRGDCGYLALAVGLVDMIKQEITAGKGPSPTLVHLNEKLKDFVFLPEDWYLKPDEFQQFDMSNYMANPKNTGCFEVRYIERVQSYLRTIGVKAYEKDLEAAINKALPGDQGEINSTDLVSNPVFGQFLEIIRHLSQNQGKIIRREFNNYQHNAVVQSEHGKKLALNVFQKMKKQFSDAGEVGIQELYSDDELLKSVALPLFIAQSTKFDDDKLVVNTESQIFQALSLYQKEGYWATSEDLIHLGSLVGVQTDMQVKGQAAEHRGMLEKTQPTIILLNDEDVGHWTTLVPASSVKPAPQQPDGFATCPGQEMSDTENSPKNRIQKS